MLSNFALLSLICVVYIFIFGLRILLGEKHSKQFQKRLTTTYQKTINKIKSNIDATPEEVDHQIIRLLEAYGAFIKRIAKFQQSKWVKQSIKSMGSFSLDDLLIAIEMIDE